MMTQKLATSALIVQQFLTEKGFAFEVKHFDASTRTAQQAADALGCQVAQIAKSLIFKDEYTGNPILIIASGSNHVDLEKVNHAMQVKLQKADADFVKRQVGFAIGGVPPVAHRQPLVTILDPALKQFDYLWAAAGTPNAVFQLKPSDLAVLTGGQWCELAR